MKMLGGSLGEGGGVGGVHSTCRKSSKLTWLTAYGQVSVFNRITGGGLGAR